MRKKLLIFILILFAFTLNNNAQNRMAHAPASAKNKVVIDANGRSCTVPMAGKQTNAQSSGQLTRITGLPVSTTAYSGFYREDFEGAFPPANWQIVDVLDNSLTWMQENFFPYSGLNDAYNPFTNQGVPGEDWLIMPRFTVGATDSLTFWFGLTDIAFPPDVTEILISTTDSSLASFTIVVDHMEEGINYPPDDISYVYKEYSLAAYAGQSIYVAFKNNNTYGDGVHIDRVGIGTRGPDAAVVSVAVPDFTGIGTITPKATFSNEWDSTISFPVTMTITGGYTSTKSVTNLLPGDSIQVTFDPWTASTAGTMLVTAEAQLIGDNSPQNNTLTESVLVMDVFTNYGWSTRTALPMPTYYNAGAASNNNTSSELYLFGGYQAGSAVNYSDGFMPVANSWLPAFSVSNMLQSVAGASAAVVKDKIYVVGGYDNSSSPINYNQIYDPATNSWSGGSAMLSAVGDYALGIYNDSLVYYMGGNGGSNDRNTVQMFSPAATLWINATPIPIAASGWRGGIIGNKIVLTGGFQQSSFSAIDSTYIGTIDPATPYSISWTSGPGYPIGTNCRMAAGASLDAASGLVLFTGGDPEGFQAEALDYTFAFDVNVNQWKIGPPKPTPAFGLCNFIPVVDNDSLYMVAVGGNGTNGPLDVNEWLNLGPFQLVIGINENNLLNIGLTSSPNPFSDRTKIEFKLDKSAKVKATITDVLGNEVVITDKMMNSGNQQLIWDASEYADGIYICRIFVDGKSASQKLIKY